MKHATATAFRRLNSGALIGGLLWLATIAFVFAILTGLVH